MSPPFGYLRDPLFVACFVVYWAHRYCARHGMSTDLLRSYLNDLICIPFWLPMMLWGLRRFGMRRHDEPPNAVEIVVPLLIWIVVFEVWIPSHPEWHVPTVADPNDILAYCLGALAATLFWRWYYRPRGAVTGRE